jgi:hypothetical protein
MSGAACALRFLHSRKAYGKRARLHTESYKGMEVHVTALHNDGQASTWDYTVRISQPGDDASSDSEITQQSGNDGEYPTAAAALEAGFVKGYAMVDALLQ